MTDPMQSFSDITYPGSRRPRRGVVEQETKEAERIKPLSGWDERPITYTIEGQETQFFYIGALGKALYRTASAMRKWEAKGYIPESPFRTPGDTIKGQHRLYTRAQIEGLIRIAEEEGILDKNRHVSNTEFTRKAKELFADLAASA